MFFISFETFFEDFVGMQRKVCNFAPAMPDDCPKCGHLSLGKHYIIEKASHDALSIGHLKLPQKIECQRHCRV